MGQSPLELQFESSKNTQAVSGHTDASTITEVGQYPQFPPKKPPRMFLKSSQNVSQNPAVLNVSLCVQHNFLESENQSSVNDHNLIVTAVLNSQNNECQNLSIILDESCFSNASDNSNNNESNKEIDNYCSSLPPQDSGFSSGSIIKKSISLNTSKFLPHKNDSDSGFASTSLKKSLSLSSQLQMTQMSSKTKSLSTLYHPFKFPQDTMSPSSPCSSQGHPINLEFVTDEFYIDESMPSSLSIEGTTSQGEMSRQLEQANNVIALFQVYRVRTRLFLYCYSSSFVCCCAFRGFVRLTNI